MHLLERFIHNFGVFFTLVSLLISRICKQFPLPHHPSIEIISGYPRVAFLDVLGNLWLFVNWAGKQEPIVTGNVLWEQFQLGTFSSRKYHMLQELQVHPALPCADTEMQWGPWNLRGRGDGYKAAQKFHNKHTPVFSVSHPREGNVRELLAGMYTRKIHGEKGMK